MVSMLGGWWRRHPFRNAEGVEFFYSSQPRELELSLTRPCHLLGAVVRMLDAEHPDSSSIAHR
jgi:hypothetical protein